MAGSQVRRLVSLQKEKANLNAVYSAQLKKYLQLFEHSQVFEKYSSLIFLKTIWNGAHGMKVLVMKII